MFEALLDELAERGLLLLTDARRPDLARRVAGGPIRGSWWAHPAGKEIFRLANALAAHPDVLVVALVDGKQTFVHRSRWPWLAAAARPDRLGAEARAWLARIEAEGEVPAGALPTAVGRELARAVAARVFEAHLPSGRHGKGAESWARWAAREGVAPDPNGAERLAAAVAALTPAGRVSSTG